MFESPNASCVSCNRPIHVGGPAWTGAPRPRCGPCQEICDKLDSRMVHPPDAVLRPDMTHPMVFTKDLVPGDQVAVGLGWPASMTVVELVRSDDELIVRLESDALAGVHDFPADPNAGWEIFEEASI